MRKIIGMFILAFTTNMNAEANTVVEEEVLSISCVSIASELTANRPDLFALAYNWCIYQKCGCN